MHPTQTTPNYPPSLSIAGVAFERHSPDHDAHGAQAFYRAEISGVALRLWFTPFREAESFDFEDRDLAADSESLRRGGLAQVHVAVGGGTSWIFDPTTSDWKTAVANAIAELRVNPSKQFVPDYDELQIALVTDHILRALQSLSADLAAPLTEAIERIRDQDRLRSLDPLPIDSHRLTPEHLAAALDVVGKEHPEMLGQSAALIKQCIMAPFRRRAGREAIF